MALPSSGPLSINDIVAEFGGAAPHGLTEYYSAAPGVPASGALAISAFYGTSAFTPQVLFDGAGAPSASFSVYNAPNAFSSDQANARLLDYSSSNANGWIPGILATNSNGARYQWSYGGQHSISLAGFAASARTGKLKITFGSSYCRHGGSVNTSNNLCGASILNSTGGYTAPWGTYTYSGGSASLRPGGVYISSGTINDYFANSSGQFRTRMYNNGSTYQTGIYTDARDELWIKKMEAVDPSTPSGWTQA